MAPPVRWPQAVCAGIVVLATLAVAACAKGGGTDPDGPGRPGGQPNPAASPAPVAVTVVAPAREATRVAYLAAAFLMREAPGARLAVEAEELRSDGAPADVIVSRAEPGDAGAFVASFWLLAAHPLSARDDIAFGTLRELYVRGTPAGSAATLLVPDVASLDPFDRGLGAPGRAQTVPPEALAPRLLADPSALALVPSGMFTDPRLAFVPVDGVDLVREPGHAPAYPLVTRLRVEAGRSDGTGGLAEALSRALRTGLRAGPPPPAIRLLFTGDVIPARCVYARQAALGDSAHAFRALAPFLSEADLTVGSLDAAISDAGTPIGCQPTFSLLAPAASVEGLRSAGYDVVTVATNHIKDCGASSCGERAFLDTLANLRAAGIAPAGGGATLAEARSPAVLDADGVRFAFLGYDAIAPFYHAGPATPGTAPLTEAYVREDVAAARTRADVVIALPHWGVEYTSAPTPEQRRLGRAALEAGATLVVGNHPHWVQATDVVDGGFVAYALGNFVFDQDWSIETQQGAILEAVFWGARLRAVRYYPVRIVDGYEPVFAEPAEARQILERIFAASAALGAP